MNCTKPCEILSYICKKWQLVNIRTLKPSAVSNNYVAIVYSLKLEADFVLKILRHQTNEPEALAYFNGNGCVKLIDYDSITKCLLLDYVRPGYTLKTFFPQMDAEAVEITGNLIRKLHTKTLASNETNFQSIEQWLQLLDNFESEKIPKDLLQKAQKKSKELLALKQQLFLLHGDLHHENIIEDRSTWIAIDPQGVIGPLEYEVIRFIMNPIPDLITETHNPATIIKNRINKFSSFFNFDKNRVNDWFFVSAILSACWAETDKNKILQEYFINLSTLVNS